MIKEWRSQGPRTIFPVAVAVAIVCIAWGGIANAQNQKFQFGVDEAVFRALHTD
jgi:hypothetical protein